MICAHLSVQVFIAASIFADQPKQILCIPLPPLLHGDAKNDDHIDLPLILHVISLVNNHLAAFTLLCRVLIFEGRHRVKCKAHT